MSGADGKSNTLWIVLGVSAGLLLICCVGGGVATYFGARKVAENPEALESGLRGIVADLAGDTDIAAQRICTDFMSEGRVEETWERTSTTFRGITDRAGLDELHAAISNVMGELQALEIRNYNVRNQLGAGKFHDLVYDGTFENGEATVRVTLRESGDDYEIESLRVESPLFLQKLAEPGGDASPDQSEER